MPRNTQPHRSQPSKIPITPPLQNPPNTLIHINSFSRSLALRNGPPHPPHKIIHRIDCCPLPAPPSSLRHKYIGTDPQLSQSFFSHPANELAFHTAADTIYKRLKEQEKEVVREKDVAVMVMCEAGMHRSVAMAERLAEEVKGSEGCGVVVRHWDLGYRMRERRERERRMRERRERERRKRERREKREREMEMGERMGWRDRVGGWEKELRRLRRDGSDIQR